LNDARKGFDMTVVIFTNCCFCLLNSFSFLWKKIHMFSQHIQYALFHASCWPQPKFSYKVNIVASLLHQHQPLCIQEKDIKYSIYYLLHLRRESAGLRTVWSGVRGPAGAGNFSLHHRVQTGSRIQPASYPMGTRGSFPGSKTAGAWSWPITSSAEVKNAWSYTSAPTVRLHGVVLN
jgi:hypothetical protein